MRDPGRRIPRIMEDQSGIFSQCLILGISGQYISCRASPVVVKLQFGHWETRRRSVVGAPHRAASVSERTVCRRYVQVRSLAVAALNAVARAMAAIAKLPLSESQL